jgi:hypothetical protein
VKQNFEFGIGRIIKSLEPCSEKIETDTWFYAKRCFLALIDNLAKQMIVVYPPTAFSKYCVHDPNSNEASSLLIKKQTLYQYCTTMQ